ncbi:FkbM family methyltransferase [Xylanimonas allomyrinae]|nr:FkbM family methyltransferase [Xylanimonas allomyrinae]
MPQPPLTSYAQNREDVVLWRALGTLKSGRYVEVGANHPEQDSVSKSFYDHGWHGITIDPVEDFVAMHRERRPHDVQLAAAITARPVDSVTLHAVPGTGLSTLVDSVSEKASRDGYQPVDVTVPARRLDSVLEEAGWAGTDIHFLLIDVEGAEADVLASIDLSVWRPWVLVIEATDPRSTTPTHEAWEPALLAAGYEFCLFDGLSRFYVSTEHADLKPTLSYPACPLDSFEIAGAAERRAAEIVEKEQEIESLTRQLVHWRSTALRGWADALAASAVGAANAANAADAGAAAELAAIRQTVSWRVTAPLRGALRVARRVRR